MTYSAFIISFRTITTAPVNIAKSEILNITFSIFFNTLFFDFTLTSIKFKEPNNIITNEIKLFVNDELISEDLVSDTFEGYKLLPQKPNDVNENNTLICDKLPSKINKNYKYISYNNEFYIWHQINFKDGDEITIQTKKDMFIQVVLF